jgi:hypothetical protein
MSDKVQAVAKGVLDRASEGVPVVPVDDLESWSSDDLKALLDYVIDNQAAHSLRLRGVLAGTSIVDKLELKTMDNRGIPLVNPHARFRSFDSIEFDFRSME